MSDKWSKIKSDILLFIAENCDTDRELSDNWWYKITRK